MEIYDDVGIKRELVSGRLTQKKVDDLIDRTFPGYDNSSKRHFLQRWLKIKPSEWWTIQALYEAALMKGHYICFGIYSIWGTEKDTEGSEVSAWARDVGAVRSTNCILVIAGLWSQQYRPRPN